MTAGRCNRANTTVQGCDAFLQHRNGGIGYARIDMTGAFQIEQSCGMIGAVKNIGRRLIDRHRPRAGHRVGLLPSMQAQRVKFQEIRFHPYSSPIDGLLLHATVMRSAKTGKHRLIAQISPLIQAAVANTKEGCRCPDSLLLKSQHPCRIVPISRCPLFNLPHWERTVAVLFHLVNSLMRQTRDSV